MKNVTFFTPLAPALAVFCFPSEFNIPEGPEYEKYQHFIDAWGDFFTNSTQKQRQLLGPLNKLEKHKEGTYNIKLTIVLRATWNLDIKS